MICSIATEMNITRLAKGLDTVEFARSLNTSQSSVSAWETGIRKPPVKAVQNYVKTIWNQEPDFHLQLLSFDYLLASIFDSETLKHFFTESSIEELEFLLRDFPVPTDNEWKPKNIGLVFEGFFWQFQTCGKREWFTRLYQCRGDEIFRFALYIVLKRAQINLGQKRISLSLFDWWVIHSSLPKQQISFPAQYTIADLFWICFNNFSLTQEEDQLTIKVIGNSGKTFSAPLQSPAIAVPYQQNIVDAFGLVPPNS